MKQQFKQILFYIVLLLSIKSKCASSEPIRPSRFEWIQIFTLSAHNRKELNKEFNQLYKKGIRTIIFRCFKNPGDSPFNIIPEKESVGVYFPSKINPVVSNLLPLVVDIAHKNGLKCYAWITTRSSQWLLKEHPQWSSERYNFKLKKFEKTKQLDIFNSGVIKHLSNSLEEIAQCNVDGILIQDDWVSRQGDELQSKVWKTFTNHFTQQKNINDLFTLRNDSIVKYKPLYFQWTRYKSEAFAKQMERLLTSVKATHPEVNIAVNIYYESVTRPSAARNWLSQDIEDLVKFCHSIDYFAIMAYQEQMSKELQLPIEKIYQILSKAYSKLKADYLIPPEKILWKIQARDWKTNRLIDDEIIKHFLTIAHDSHPVMVPYRSDDYTFLSSISDDVEFH